MAHVDEKKPFSRGKYEAGASEWDQHDSDGTEENEEDTATRFMQIKSSDMTNDHLYRYTIYILYANNTGIKFYLNFAG